MGLGKSGQLLEQATPLDYVWGAGKGNHMVWIGDAHAGVRVKLMGDAAGFESPQFIPTAADLPSSWHNGGRGGVAVSSQARLRAFGGPRVLRPGESVAFRFELLLTPVRPLDLAAHSRMRYYQVGYPTPDLVEPDAVAHSGATVLNIHQGVNGLLNPHINYPFERETIKHLSDYAARAHALGLKVKAYYTIRELSSYADELWVLRSLGDEVLMQTRQMGGDPRVAGSRTADADGAAEGGSYRRLGGGGDAWMNEHLVEDYAACWQTPLADGTFDAALCNTGISRWVNYYVEGLSRFLRAPGGVDGLGLGLDGIYYDGIAFGAHTMRRIRRVMEQVKGAGNGLIDLHCGNNMLGDSYGHVSPALQFMHLMPYIDSLWFGEGFEYGSGGPAYWLVEASGIPFGLMSDMMGGGHTWKGLLHGMTHRQRCADPLPLWKVYDSFGIANASMRGYWEHSPVLTTTCADVLATAFVVRGRRTLGVLARHEKADGGSGGMRLSADEPVCGVRFDWDALGMPRGGAHARLTWLDPFMEAGGKADVPLRSEDGYVPRVRLNPGGGALLLLEAK